MSDNLLTRRAEYHGLARGVSSAPGMNNSLAVTTISLRQGCPSRGGI